MASPAKEKIRNFLRPLGIPVAEGRASRTEYRVEYET